jgi:hypothetical protein
LSTNEQGGVVLTPSSSIKSYQRLDRGSQSSSNPTYREHHPPLGPYRSRFKWSSPFSRERLQYGGRDSKVPGT